MLRLLALLLPWLAFSSSYAATLDLDTWRGRVVVVDFWASWCEPCRASFPWLNSLQQRYETRGLVVVTVNLDENQADAKRFLQENPSVLPVIDDPAGEIAKKYQLLAMPTSLIFDRQGVLRFRHNGFFESKIEDYEKHILTLVLD